MKNETEIEKIVKQLLKHKISKREAINKLLNLHSVGGCYWEKTKKIELNLEDMASNEIGKGLCYNLKDLK